MINMAELNPYAYWNKMEEIHKEILELLICLVEADKNRHLIIRHLQAVCFFNFYSLQMSHLHE